MQLGELQSHLQRFQARSASVVALSVDPPSHSRNMIGRMKLAFPVASDQDQRVMNEFGVINPDTEELALHAVYIVNEDRRVIYRKVARRRPKSQELLDAIDYYRGDYPMGDEGPAYAGVPVAFPRNNFQALIEAATNSVLPESLNPAIFTDTLSLLHRGESDEATISYSRLMSDVADSHTEQELLSAAAWFAVKAVGLSAEAMRTGRDLNDALVQQRLLTETTGSAERSDLEAQLDQIRGTVRENDRLWRLRSLKTTLRSYRELSIAALR